MGNIAYHRLNINRKVCRLELDSAAPHFLNGFYTMVGQVSRGLAQESGAASDRFGRANVIRKFFKRLDIRLIGIFIIIGLLWDTPVVYPMKIFVVFMHEVSHGLAAIATGGRIVEIQIVPQQGGHAITAGGSRFWTLTAGYLGSLAWGGLILVLAARTQLGKLLSTLIGIGMVFVSIFYLRNTFGFLFGIGFGGGLVVAGRLLPEWMNDWILRVIGLTSCLYAILDIKSDILDRSQVRSDARMLHEELTPYIPTFVWGLVWILIAIIGTLFFLYIVGEDRSEPDELMSRHDL